MCFVNTKLTFFYFTFFLVQIAITPIEDLVEQAEKDNFMFVKIETDHINSYESVPFNEDHRDPFDRLIIATALSEGIPIISADEKFQLYRSIITLIEA